jgi:hypothetical protein
MGGGVRRAMWFRREADHLCTIIKVVVFCLETPWSLVHVYRSVKASFCFFNQTWQTHTPLPDDGGTTSEGMTSYPWRNESSDSHFDSLKSRLLILFWCSRMHGVIPILHISLNYMVRNSLKALWSLYVPPGLTFRNSTFCPRSVFICLTWISEQTAIISLYSINP